MPEVIIVIHCRGAIHFRCCFYLAKQIAVFIGESTYSERLITRRKKKKYKNENNSLYRIKEHAVNVVYYGSKRAGKGVMSNFETIQSTSMKRTHHLRAFRMGLATVAMMTLNPDLIQWEDEP